MLQPNWEHGSMYLLEVNIKVFYLFYSYTPRFHLEKMAIKYISYQN